MTAAQLSLLDAALVHADTGDDHQWLPGEDVAADIDAVLAYIPSFGGSKNTARAGRKRSIACLYARPDLLPEDDADIVFSIGTTCSGWNFRGEPGQFFVRLNGEPWDGRGYGDSRTATLPVIAKRHGDAVWMLDFRGSGNAHAIAATVALLAGLRPGLRACGLASWPQPDTLRVLLPGLAPLILALRWSDHVSAAVFLAGSGVAPKSDAWAVLVDQALACGMPWAEKLAELSARHPRDVMSRALVWVHVQGIARRVAGLSGACRMNPG